MMQIYSGHTGVDAYAKGALDLCERLQGCRNEAAESLKNTSPDSHLTHLRDSSLVPSCLVLFTYSCPKERKLLTKEGAQVKIFILERGRLLEITPNNNANRK